MRFSKFDPASTEHPGVIIPLSYGGTTPYAERLARTDLPPPRPPLQPGETVELTFGSMEMLTLNAAQARFGIPTNIEAIQVTIQRVIFDDDEMWSTGEPMYRDPKNPDRWIPKSYKLDHPTVGNRF
jgi:hypothetical protein